MSAPAPPPPPFLQAQFNPSIAPLNFSSQNIHVHSGCYQPPDLEFSLSKRPRLFDLPTSNSFQNPSTSNFTFQNCPTSSSLQSPTTSSSLQSSTTSSSLQSPQISNSFQNLPQVMRMSKSALPPNGKGTCHVFFKTRLCQKNKTNECPYGSNCNFAHGFEEIRQPPPNWQQIVASEQDRLGGNWGDSQRVSRLKLCKKFHNGEECPYGEKCNFMHEEPWKHRESSAINIGTTVMNNNSDNLENITVLSAGEDGNGLNQKPVFWKTRICNKWEVTGSCIFGEKCHFAHGQAELQKFGASHPDNEVMHTSSLPSRPPRSLKPPIAATTKDTSPSSTPAPCNEQVPNRKNLLGLKGLKKISGIYADWID